VASLHYSCGQHARRGGWPGIRKTCLYTGSKSTHDRSGSNLISVLRDDIGTLDWMSAETKKQAIAKLNAFTTKVGYPDKWRDYSALKLTRASYFDNLAAAGRFGSNYQLSKIGKPVDKSEWGMTPPTVNAYNNSLFNEIVFPAGILQPPFFNPEADDRRELWGIGAVIGHEMTHVLTIKTQI